MRAMEDEIVYLPSIFVGWDFCCCNWRLLELNLSIELRIEGIVGFDIGNAIIEFLLEIARGWLKFL